MYSLITSASSTSPRIEKQGSPSHPYQFISQNEKQMDTHWILPEQKRRLHKLRSSGLN
ncbi:MAG: hypothetical protein HC880_03800 [Bacteroidia bacterium]|nr:hypothetical protein [Bacteroidia bacterium]